MDFCGIWTKNEKMRIATGLNLDEAIELFSVFKNHIQINPNGQGRPAKLDAKQIFIMTLAYYRHNLSFEFLSLIFKIDDAAVHRWIEKAEKSLEDSLKALGTLPQVITDNCKNLRELEMQDDSVLIDGAEQPIRRPQDKEAQKLCYSGKKKTHTKTADFFRP